MTTHAAFAKASILVGIVPVRFHRTSSVMTVPKKKRKKRLTGVRKKSVEPNAERLKKSLRSEARKMQTAAVRETVARRSRRASGDAYAPPQNIITSTLGELIQGVRTIPEDQQERMGFRSGGLGAKIWMAGDVSLVKRPCVAVVGARNVSPEGAARSRRLARELAQAGVVVVSGLAKGVDTEALRAAIEAKGRAIAVIGTPIKRAYPAENNRLQEKIYREHLLVSQFPPDRRVFPSNFPERNKLMAAISDATVIIEASDESGSLHQAAECTRLGRWLFIAKSVAENPTLRWPKDFLRYATTRVLNQTSDILDLLRVN